MVGDRVAGLAVKNPLMVAFARHYGTSVELCERADPQTKGGSEATVKIAKGDLVPTDANLLPDYANWNRLGDECEAFLERVNARPHAVTKRPPLEMLEVERGFLHPMPKQPFSFAFGRTRKVSDTALVAWRGAWYSVPHQLAGESVLVRERGDTVIVTAAAGDGFREAARHRLAGRGQRVVDESHYPPAPAGPLNRRPRPGNATEEEFLGIGPNAALWLKAASAAGTSRLKERLEEIVQLARLDGREAIDDALAVAAAAGRFGFGDIEQISVSVPPGPWYRAGPDRFLQNGTSAWRNFGVHVRKEDDR